MVMSQNKTVLTSGPDVNRAFKGDAGLDPELIELYTQNEGDIICPRCKKSIWSERTSCSHGMEGS